MVTEEEVIATLKKIYDPELPVSIFELGLIYGVEVAPSGEVDVRMTLTAPNCPAAQSLPAEVAAKVRAMPGVTDARVKIVFDPPWTTDRLSEAARLELGLGLIEL